MFTRRLEGREPPRIVVAQATFAVQRPPTRMGVQGDEGSASGGARSAAVSATSYGGPPHAGASAGDGTIRRCRQPLMSGSSWRPSLRS